MFFPIGTQHYIKSACDEDLLFILAFSTRDQVRTGSFKRLLGASDVLNAPLSAVSGPQGTLSQCVLNE